MFKKAIALMAICAMFAIAPVSLFAMEGKRWISPADGEWVYVNKEMADQTVIINESIYPIGPAQARLPGGGLVIRESWVRREEQTPNGNNAQFSVRSVGGVRAFSPTGRFYARADLRNPQGQVVLRDTHRWAWSDQWATSHTSWMMGGGMAVVANLQARITVGNVDGNWQ